MSQVIPDAAVEAAARGLHMERWPGAPWDALSAESRGHVRKQARGALEAALPHLK